MKILGKLQYYIGASLRGMRIAYLRNAGVIIGSNTFISLGARIDITRGSITIGDSVVITYRCVILSHDYSIAMRQISEVKQSEVTIGNHVFLGVGTIVLPNVTIGEHSVIGAGSVVIRDIPPYSVAVGNPCKIVGKVKKRDSF